MKVIFLIVSVLMLSQPLLAQEKLSQKEKRQIERQLEFEAILNLLDSMNYTFVAEHFLSTKGGSIDLTTQTSYLKIIGDSASAYLPYFGRAYNVAYSNKDGGIKFEGGIEELSQSVNEKKRSTTLNFKVTSKGDVFDCSLVVFGSGSATLTVISPQRQPASYNGRVELRDDR